MTSRKVQAEIDRVAKKIQEGIADFEDTLEKMNASSNPNMVNKYEASLKTEIKKLQRCRDQMKAWIASPEVKDKSFVTENRKLIESYMERFKAIEKEMKTKAYSKEGLMQSEKIDPKQKEKSETSGWITEFVDELSRQVNVLEAEAEGIGLLPKKKKDHSKVERLNNIKHNVERHKHHISRLELVLRMLANDHVSADKINEIKDSVAYYVEENQEVDFDEDEFMYDELNLDEEEELYAVITEEHQLAQSTLDNNDDEKLFVEPVKPKSSKAATKIEDKPQPLPPFKEPAVVKTPSASSKTRAAETSLANASKEAPVELPSDASKPTENLPPLKKTQSLSPKNSMKKITVVPSKKASKEPLLPKNEEISEKPASTKNLRSLAEVVSASVSKPSESLQKTKPISIVSAPSSSKPQPAVAPTPVVSAPKPPITPPAAPVTTEAVSSLFQAPAPVPIPASVTPQMQERRQVGPPSAKSSPQVLPKVESSPPAPQQKPPVAVPQRMKPAMSNLLKPETPGGKMNFPFFLDDLSKTLHETRAKFKIFLDVMAKSRSPNAPPKVTSAALVARSYYERMLETGYHHKIELSDLDPPRLYTPLHPHNTPASYPCQPLASLLDPKMYSSLDQDTLFFIFYYQKSTYQQYLAALELQKRWRFHTKYSMWFRRAAEPEVVNPQYEIGTFTFFDYNETWAERSEPCLKIVYDQVEEKLQV